ncbi:hypothetical protein [Desulfosarcina sp.]|uniref:hypothetical protein n=1 Tax=Desulfosarcina sp. TaxID=2027861 RepID=UPI003567BD91
MSSVASTPSLRPRPSTLYVSSLLSLVLMGILVAATVHRGTAADHRRVLAQQAQLVSRLDLTDLCLFTEARYTRHLSQADLFSAFQDHPMSFEHFPSGSLTLPPVLNREQWAVSSEQ